MISAIERLDASTLALWVALSAWILGGFIAGLVTVCSDRMRRQR